MNLFSISDLEQYSGIKAHTIRIWELRYNALKPNRSEGNTRYYDNNQLRRLLNIASLKDSNYKVSQLCKMSDDRLNELLDQKLTALTTEDNPYEYFISQILVAGIEYDQAHFEKIFSSCILRIGLKSSYVNVIYPFLVRAGLLWLNETLSIGSEHFLSNLIRQKLHAAIESLPPAKNNENSWLLFLPVNEHHDIGILFSYYLLRLAGKKVIYLGSNVPFECLEAAVKETKPENLFFFLVHYNKPEISQSYLNQMKKAFKETKVHFSGNYKLISSLRFGNELNWIQNVEQFENEIK